MGDLAKRLRGWARDIQEGSTATWAMDQDLKGAASRIEELEAENARLREALTPSGDTKAEYAGEFHISVYDADDEYGNEIWRKVPVDWTTIKAIMAAIKSRATLAERKGTKP